MSRKLIFVVCCYLAAILSQLTVTGVFKRGQQLCARSSRSNFAKSRVHYDGIYRTVFNHRASFISLAYVTDIYIEVHYFQADQRVFKDLMAEKIPRLHRHLEAAGVDSSLITFNWLLCIFCDNVPPETMLHIWDVFLSEGSKVGGDGGHLLPRMTFLLHVFELCP